MVEFFDLLNGVFSYFAFGLLPSVFKGEPTGIAVAGLVFIIFLALFFELSQLVYRFVKHFFLFLVVIISLLVFVINFGDKLFSPQPDFFILAVGVIGLLMGLVAFIISIFSVTTAYSSIQKHAEEQYKQTPSPTAPKVSPTQIQQPDFLSQQALSGKTLMQSVQDDRSLLAVLSYSIIAQFGVFSGFTVSAPSIEVGMAFFAAFFVGAFIFIKTSYHNYSRGIIHLVFATVFGFILSIMLGHYWGTIPLPELLSINYFTSHALVALVTGIAVSLLLGSKH